MKRLIATRGLLLGLFCLLGTVASAQPNLNFKRIVVYGSTVELYFGVGCNGNPAYNMTRDDFRIFEDSALVRDFNLWCPDPTVRCAISTVLVFDASGSMSGSGNAGAKAAGRAFVDQMDGWIDEAAVLFYNTTVTTAQQTTTLKSQLYSAIDSLPAFGGTATWDGTHAGITEMINNGINQCRAVIVLTDGNDNSSTHTPGDIISLANRNRIRVFTIGLGSSINAHELEMIALLSGGRYYQTPDAAQLTAIYKDIATTMFQGFNECVITYESGCRDGSTRMVEMRLENFCGGTDVKTKSYRAPSDSTSFSTVDMDLGDVEGMGNTDITLPLHLLTPVDPQVAFRRLAFTLQFDSQYVQLAGAAAPTGSLLEGCIFDVTPVSGGAHVSIFRITYDPTRFKLIAPTSDTQTKNPADIEPGQSFEISWQVEAFLGSKHDSGSFCIRATFDNHRSIVCCNRVYIPRRESDLDCTLEVPDIRIRPDRTDYTPMPFTVRAGLRRLVGYAGRGVDSIAAEAGHHPDR